MILCSAEPRIILCLPTHVINFVINDNSLEILYISRSVKHPVIQTGANDFCVTSNRLINDYCYSDTVFVIAATIQNHIFV